MFIEGCVSWGYLQALQAAGYDIQRVVGDRRVALELIDRGWESIAEQCESGWEVFFRVVIDIDNLHTVPDEDLPPLIGIAPRRL